MEENNKIELTDGSFIRINDVAILGDGGSGQFQAIHYGEGSNRPISHPRGSKEECINDVKAYIEENNFRKSEKSGTKYN
jgi:hypothetical protein